MPRPKLFDKEEVLEKAVNFFWEKGYNGTSIGELIKYLGISKSSMYDTFGNKQQLYEAAIKAYRQKGTVFLKNQLQTHTSAKEGITSLFKNAITESVNDTKRKGCFIVNCTTEYLDNQPKIVQELLDNKVTFENILGEVIQRGIDNQEFNPNLDVKATATYLYTFLSGLRVMSKVEPCSEEMTKSVELGLKVLEG